jgi:hypothetical protein
MGTAVRCVDFAMTPLAQIHDVSSAIQATTRHTHNVMSMIGGLLPAHPTPSFQLEMAFGLPPLKMSTRRLGVMRYVRIGREDDSHHFPQEIQPPFP